MPIYLCLTVRFLNPMPMFHGRADEGEPEWPPSPLRVFQALVAAAASRWKADSFRDYAEPALRWLERQPPPEIVAPTGEFGTPFRTAVPNNDLDRVARAWSVGNYSNSGDANPAIHRSLKPIRPTRLIGGNAIHYAYSLADFDPEFERVRESLFAAARNVTHVGWGIDMATIEAKTVTGSMPQAEGEHHWRAVANGGTQLRSPIVGTLDSLVDRHREFLARSANAGVMDSGKPFTAFGIIGYSSPTAGVGNQPQSPMAAFEIHRTLDDQEQNPGNSRFRPFHHVRRVATVAGMVRHAAGTVAQQMGHPTAWVNERVLGHGNEKDGQSTSNERLMFLPLPSIQPVVGVGGIRRVLVVGWPGCTELPDLRRRLNGAELIDKDTGKSMAVLSQLAKTDGQIAEYIEPSRTWTTVTPVILPGHDDPDGLRRKYHERTQANQASAEEQKHLLDRLDGRVLSLLWKAFEQAGWTTDALAGAHLEYRKVGWLRGLELAKNYELPKVNYPKYHVRVIFPHAVRGPLVIGAGRYRGFGLFVGDRE